MASADVLKTIDAAARAALLAFGATLGATRMGQNVARARYIGAAVALPLVAWLTGTAGIAVGGI